MRCVTGDRMIADCLTKKGANGAGLLDVLRTGELRGYSVEEKKKNCVRLYC